MTVYGLNTEKVDSEWKRKEGMWKHEIIQARQIH